MATTEGNLDNGVSVSSQAACTRRKRHLLPDIFVKKSAPRCKEQSTTKSSPASPTSSRCPHLMPRIDPANDSINAKPSSVCSLLDLPNGIIHLDHAVRDSYSYSTTEDDDDDIVVGRFTSPERVQPSSKMDEVGRSANVSSASKRKKWTAMPSVRVRTQSGGYCLVHRPILRGKGQNGHHPTAACPVPSTSDKLNSSSNDASSNKSSLIRTNHALRALEPKHRSVPASTNNRGYFNKNNVVEARESRRSPMLQQVNHRRRLPRATINETTAKNKGTNMAVEVEGSHVFGNGVMQIITNEGHVGHELSREGLTGLSKQVLNEIGDEGGDSFKLTSYRHNPRNPSPVPATMNLRNECVDVNCEENQTTPDSLVRASPGEFIAGKVPSLANDSTGRCRPLADSTVNPDQSYTSIIHARTEEPTEGPVAVSGRSKRNSSTESSSITSASSASSSNGQITSQGASCFETSSTEGSEKRVRAVEISSARTPLLSLRTEKVTDSESMSDCGLESGPVVGRRRGRGSIIMSKHLLGAAIRTKRCIIHRIPAYHHLLASSTNSHRNLITAFDTCWTGYDVIFAEASLQGDSDSKTDEEIGACDGSAPLSNNCRQQQRESNNDAISSGVTWWERNVDCCPIHSRTENDRYRRRNNKSSIGFVESRLLCHLAADDTDSSSSDAVNRLQQRVSFLDRGNHSVKNGAVRGRTKSCHVNNRTRRAVGAQERSVTNESVKKPTATRQRQTEARKLQSLLKDIRKLKPELQKLLLENLNFTDSSSSTSFNCPTSPIIRYRRSSGESAVSDLDALARDLSSAALSSALEDETFLAFLEETTAIASSDTEAAQATAIFKRPTLVVRRQLIPLDNYELSDDDGSSDVPFNTEEAVRRDNSQPEDDLLQTFRDLLPEEKLPLEVRIEIDSNWGDFEKVGLNWLQFFDARGDPYDFSSDEDDVTIAVSGDEEVLEEVSVVRLKSFLTRQHLQSEGAKRPTASPVSTSAPDQHLDSPLSIETAARVQLLQPAELGSLRCQPWVCPFPARRRSKSSSTAPSLSSSACLRLRPDLLGVPVTTYSGSVDPISDLDILEACGTPSSTSRVTLLFNIHPIGGYLTAIKFWNYFNEAEGSSAAGAKDIRILLNGKEIVRTRLEPAVNPSNGITSDDIDDGQIVDLLLEWEASTCTTPDSARLLGSPAASSGDFVEEISEEEEIEDDDEFFRRLPVDDGETTSVFGTDLDEEADLRIAFDSTDDDFRHQSDTDSAQQQRLTTTTTTSSGYASNLGYPNQTATKRVVKQETIVISKGATYDFGDTLDTMHSDTSRMGHKRHLTGHPPLNMTSSTSGVGMRGSTGSLPRWFEDISSSTARPKSQNALIPRSSSRGKSVGKSSNDLDMDQEEPGVLNRSFSFQDEDLLSQLRFAVSVNEDKRPLSNRHRSDRISSARYGRRALSATPETRGFHMTASSATCLSIPAYSSTATSPSPSLPATPTERFAAGLRRGSVPPNLLSSGGTDDDVSPVGSGYLTYHPQGRDPSSSNARVTAKDEHELEMEESWNSLASFNMTQRGRLCFGAAEGDASEMYTNQAKVAYRPAAAAQTPTASGEENEGFIIPELPRGKQLIINIKTTWGDNHYVGFNGIEVFSSAGVLVDIEKIWADPADINVLPEYNKDPRVVKNLIDGVYQTHDDFHVWLTPFTPGRDHFVFLEFKKTTSVALIRIWNYNKSRIHSYRGAKDIEMRLDSKLIFSGEIARATGGTSGSADGFGDTILFTLEEEILEKISKHDSYFGQARPDSNESAAKAAGVVCERPKTADTENGGSQGQRPFTSARSRGDLCRRVSVECKNMARIYSGKTLQITFAENWGDSQFIGITGILVLNQLGEPISLPAKSVSLISPNHRASSDTVKRLMNGKNVTDDRKEMWLCPYNTSGEIVVAVDLPQAMNLGGIRVWNYNGTIEDTYRGVKLMKIALDDKPVSEKYFLVRRGPGHTHYDFAQDIIFSRVEQPAKQSVSRSTSNDGPSMDHVIPRGYVYQINLLSSWGDPYYVGLNGIQLFDATGGPITVTGDNVAAYPESVNVLSGIDNDVRTPDKLVDGVNDTNDGRHMWLAPVLPDLINKFYIVFDSPQEVSMIHFWNYAKTANRGVREFQVLVDDLLVYSGVLEKVRLRPGSPGPVQYQTVLFSSDDNLVIREASSLIRNQEACQEVQMMNHPSDGATSRPAVNQALRPYTSQTAKNSPFASTSSRKPVKFAPFSKF